MALRLKGTNWIFAFVLCLCFWDSFSAQELIEEAESIDDQDYYFEEYQDQSLNEGKSIEEIQWLESVKEVDYYEEQRKKKKKKEKEENKEEKKKEESNSNWFADWWSGLGMFLKVIIIGLLLVLVLFIIYSLMKLERNKGIVVERSIADKLENIEEELLETEVDGLLRASLENKDYKVAIRLYFLMVLQKLDDKKWIEYKKQKTNFLYLREMRDKSEYKNFRELTYAYEYSWYGDVEVDKGLFERLQSRFNHFLNQLAQ